MHDNHVGESVNIDGRTGQITEQNDIILRVQFPGDPMGVIMSIATYESDFRVKKGESDNDE